MDGQSGWRFCDQCFGMFYAGFLILGDDLPGVCPANPEGHRHQGFVFYLPHDVPPLSVGQAGWRFCEKCWGMFADVFPPGVCPAGGIHVAQGFKFELPFVVDGVFKPGQPDWRRCTKCMGLFFDGAAAKGICPAGGGHNGAGGTNLILPHRDFPAMSFIVFFLGDTGIQIFGTGFEPNQQVDFLTFYRHPSSALEQRGGFTFTASDEGKIFEESLSFNSAGAIGIGVWGFDFGSGEGLWVDQSK